MLITYQTSKNEKKNTIFGITSPLKISKLDKSSVKATKVLLTDFFSDEISLFFNKYLGTFLEFFFS
jgi:hypothetical protein